MPDNEVINQDVYVAEEQDDIEVIETVDFIDVTDSTTFTIDSLDAFPALGESNENLKHQLLNGRELSDQHPITAITGLREELNDIEALDVVYSDKRNQANYYLWEDENILQENRVGYFVSACSDINEIKICTSDNEIFGVTVDEAGFVGAQDDIVRDIKYGLVVTTGIAHVRCESSINIGDYVISNDYGCATRNEAGYKVVGRHRIDGIEYAEITLVTPIESVCNLSNKVNSLSDRVDDAEINIAAAMNVANSAYNKSVEVGEVSEEAIKNALEAFGKADDAIESVEKIEQTVSSTNTIAVEAKAIAESAATAAKSMCDEAIKVANDAVTDTSELRKEFEKTIEGINTDIDNTELELEATKESIVTTKNDLQDNINQAVDDIENLEKDLQPLIVWPEGASGDDIKGVAGFVARADEDSITIGSLVKWQGETNESIAAFKQEVAEDYATQEMVTEVGDNLALFQQEVSDTYATQEMVTQVDDALTSYKQEVEKNYATQQMLSSVEENLASYKQEVTDTYATQQMVTAVDENLASYKQEVGETYATQEMVTKLESDTSKALTDYKQEVQDEYATQEMVTTLETNTSQALADYKQVVGETYATNTSLANLKTETTEAIAASEEKATNTYASKSDLTSFESDTNTAMARIEQKADANGAYIQSTVANIDKYSVGPYSQAYGFTLEQARSVLTEGMIYVPTQCEGEVYHSEIYEYTEIDSEGNEIVKKYPDEDGYQFTKGYTYTWEDIDDSSDTTTMMWKESVGEVVMFGSAPSGDSLDLWYTDTDVVEDGYEPYTLYKRETYADENGDTQNHWVAVATLAGNSQSRAVSQIRQDANSIEFSVTNMRGDVSYSKNWIDDNSSNIQDVVSWKSDVKDDVSQIATIKQTADNAGASVALVVEERNGEKVVNAASIVTAIVDDKSSIGLLADNITLEADNIDLSGYVTIESLKGEGTTEINGSNITTGSIQSKNYVANTSGMKLDLTNGKWDSAYFKIDEFGKMTATAGDIGGMTISSTSLIKKNNDGYGFGLSIDTYKNGTGTGNVLVVGSIPNDSDWSSASFRVTGDGKMYATAGSIGGWNIGDSAITNRFYDSGTNTTYYTFMQSTSGTNDHVFDVRQVQGDYSSTNPSSWNHKFYVRNDGYLYATNAYIAGTISAETVLSSGVKFGDSSSKLKINTNGIVFTSNESGYNGVLLFEPKTTTAAETDVEISTTDLRISSPFMSIGGNYPSLSQSKLEMVGTWTPPTWDSSSKTNSDFNLKNTIELLNDNYGVFVDALIPVRYKYNNGTSDRFHTGFIAQDVFSAMNKAGISSQEFAGLVIDNIGTENERWALRYEEFIALNTWQIQKLKSRITELEQIVEKLQQKEE